MSDHGFTVAGLRRVDRGALVATFTIDVAGVGRIDAVLFSNSAGRFVKAAAIKDAAGAHVRTVSFAPEFAEAVRAEVERMFGEGEEARRGS